MKICLDKSFNSFCLEWLWTSERKIKIKDQDLKIKQNMKEETSSSEYKKSIFSRAEELN